MFAGIDLYLEFQWQAFFRLHSVSERNPPLGLFPLRNAKPGVELFLKRIHHRTDWPGLDLNQINILRIAGWGEMEFEQGCTAPERQFICQCRVIEYFNQGTADNKVLLYLIALRPGSCLLPFGDKSAIYQRSGSTSVFTKTCQRLFFFAPLMLTPGISGVGMSRMVFK